MDWFSFFDGTSTVRTLDDFFFSFFNEIVEIVALVREADEAADGERGTQRQYVRRP